MSDEDHDPISTVSSEPPSWAGGASLAGGSTDDKYARYLSMVRSNQSKDSIKRQMMADGLTQREIIVFFRAYPVGGATSKSTPVSRLAPPLQIDTEKAEASKQKIAASALPKPRQIGIGVKVLRNSPGVKKSSSKKTSFFGTSTASPSRKARTPQSAASKNAKYFAELSRVYSDLT